MRLIFNIKKGTDCDKITVSPQVPPEITVELEGEAEELMPFFDRLSKDTLKIE